LAIKPFTKAVKKAARDGDNGAGVPRFFVNFWHGIKICKRVHNGVRVAIKVSFIVIRNTVGMFFKEVREEVFGVLNEGFG